MQAQRESKVFVPHRLLPFFTKEPECFYHCFRGLEIA